MNQPRPPVPVTKVPARLERLAPFFEVGWGLLEFVTPQEAAAFVEANRSAAMPCWRRWEIIDGALMRIR